MKAKRIFLPLSLLATVLLSACSMGVKGLTPTELPRDPMGVYTIQARIAPQSDTIDRESVRASVVIDGVAHPMSQSPRDETIFEYDHRLPEGQDELFYHFLVTYQLHRPGREEGVVREYRSLMHGFRLKTRYAISVEADSAPIGTAVGLRGRDFSRDDRVLVDNTPAETRYVSQDQIRFVVPNVRADVRHTVGLRRGETVERVGTLLVEPANPLSVVPSIIELERGQRQALVLSLDNPAPSGGLAITIETDIPDSLTMPEVRIPGGARTVSVSIEGTERGEGTLFLSGPGLPEVTVPVTIR